MKKISVVVPTIRQTCLERFLREWNELFCKHEVSLFVVHDGEQLVVENRDYSSSGVNHIQNFPLESILTKKKHQELICNFSSSCKNLGFATVAHIAPETDIVVVLDDDCYPSRNKENYDAIEHHCQALELRGPLDWLPTALPPTRGFPYAIRKEAPVMLSHGGWENIPDFDAATTLTRSDAKETLPLCGFIPRGIYTPICGMNIAFNIEAMPYVYFAPVGDVPGCERFDDIWMGIHMLRSFWEKGWLVSNGFAVIHHDRASNVWKNLQQEAVGIEINETYWQEDFELPDHLSYLQEWFDGYDDKRERWHDMINEILQY